MQEQTQVAHQALAEEIGRSGAQRSAILKALRLYDERVIAGAREPDATLRDAEGAPRLMTARADTVIFVLSGEGTGDRDRAHVRQMLSTLLERKERIHVVTAGRMGVELEAMKWASRFGQPYSEIAAVWAVPNGDGSTRRNPNARNPRNSKLRVFAQTCVAEGREVLVAAFGEERTSDAIEPLLVKAGARPRMGSRYFDEAKHLTEEARARIERELQLAAAAQAEAAGVTVDVDAG